MDSAACLAFITLMYITNLTKANEFSFGMGSEFNLFSYFDESSTPKNTSTGTDLVDVNIAPAFPATNTRLGEIMEDKVEEEEIVRSPKEEENVDGFPRTEKEGMVLELLKEENIEKEMVKLLKEEEYVDDAVAAAEVEQVHTEGTTDAEKEKMVEPTKEEEMAEPTKKEEIVDDIREAEKEEMVEPLIKEEVKKETVEFPNN